MVNCLVGLCIFLLVAYTAANDVTWYIGGPNHPNTSANVAECGRTAQLPCINLSIVLQFSEVFEINRTVCALSTNEGNRSSTTIIFLSGTHLLPALCLFNWSNLYVKGEADVSIVPVENGLIGDYGLFTFINSSNITINNLDFFVNIHGRTALLFVNITDLYVSSCVYHLPIEESLGIVVRQPRGDVVIHGCSFIGSVSNMTNSAGLRLVYGEGASTVKIDHCDFEYFYAEPMARRESYANARTVGRALVLSFNELSIGHEVEISHCIFADNVANTGSTLLMLFDLNAQQNTILVTESQFIRNRNLYGAMGIYHWRRSSDNSVTIRNSNFSNNTANLEGGGIFVAFLSRHVTNLLRIDNCVFEYNTANEGGAIHLFNSPAWFTHSVDASNDLVSVNISDCTFTSNTAQGSSVLNVAVGTEGIINALRIRLFLSNTNVLTHNVGSAVLLRASQAIISDQIRFEKNHAYRGAALKITAGSKVDATAVVEARFIENSAGYKGGAIHTDEQSSSLSANEYAHLSAQFLPGNCFMLFGNENTSPAGSNTNINSTTRFYFVNNTADKQGQTMDVFTLRLCRVSNFLPPSVEQFVPVRLGDNHTVVYETDDDHQSTITGPNFIFFYGASTKCYKQVANTVYLLPNCSNDLLYNTFRNHTDLQCAYEEILNEIEVRFGQALKPTVDKLLAPWTSLDGSWTQPPKAVRRQECVEVNPGNLFLSPAPGEEFDLTIQVADQLLNFISSNIYIQVYSEPGSLPGVLQLNGIQYPYDARLYFTPNRPLRGLTLVGLPGTKGQLIIVTESQITGQDLVLFVDFQLANCPVGYCPPKVTDRSEVNRLIQEEYSYTQRIPEQQLLTCNCIADGSCGLHGYELAETARCILGYTIEFSGIHWAGIVPPVDGDHDTLTSLSSPCTAVTAAMPFTNNLTKWATWTLIHDSESRSRSAGSEAIAANPIDVAPYLGIITPGGGADILCFNDINISDLIEFKDKGEFYYDLCVPGYCKADIEDDWILTDVNYPCNDNREGVLCGQCKPGYAVKPQSLECSDCSNANPAWVILLTLIFGLLLVVVVVLLNLGASPPLDSLLFFIQAALVLLDTRVDYKNVQHLSVFTLDYSFNLCLTSDFDAFDRIFFKFATPFYILLLLVVIIVLSSFRPFSKYFGRHSYLQAIWLIILISYVDISQATLELLHCRKIGVENSHQVFYADSNVPCYRGKHLPAAIFATLFSAFVIFPFPIYVFVASYWPKFKPITDVYCSVYKDDRRWWVVINLGRRLCIAILAVFIGDYIYRHLAITILASFLVIIDGVTWPHPKFVDNFIHLGCTSIFLLLCVFTYPVLNRTIDPYFIVSWTFISVVIVVTLCRLIYLLRDKVSKLFQPCCSKRPLNNKYVNSIKFMVTSWKEVLSRDSNKSLDLNSISTADNLSIQNYNEFREPLLEDSFIQLTTVTRNTNSRNSSSNNSTSKNSSSK